LSDHTLQRFFLGLRASFPVVVGYLPIAFSFGLMSHEGGLPLWAAALMSMIVYTGAGQFAALSMLGMGTPGLEIVMAVLFMNLRHVVMNLALLPKLAAQGLRFGLGLRALVSLGVTDETFAVALFSGKGEVLTPAGMLGLNLGAWASWWIGSVAGAWAAGLVPKSLNAAMAVRGNRKGLLIALGAMGVHLAARQVLAPGWALVAAILLGASLTFLLPEGDGHAA
jgi:predicted branched-subunit amino acid permease